MIGTNRSILWFDTKWAGMGDCWMKTYIHGLPLFPAVLGPTTGWIYMDGGPTGR